MSADLTPSALDRRLLLRGGAVLAGAAGVVALGAVAAPPATAADGSAVLQGAENHAGSTTALRIDEPGGGPDATLELGNDNGPSLALQALGADWQGDLGVGEIANTVIGPSIGVLDYDGSVTTDYLATGFDLGALPLLTTVSPSRMVDTRSSVGRAGIVRTSADAFDSAHRLRAGSWMDLALFPADSDFTVDSVFVNVTVAAPLSGGYLTVYYPGDRPQTSNLNFSTGQVVCNASLVPVAVVNGYFAIRVFSNATTHVVVDLTGATLSDVPGPDQALARTVPRAVRRPRVARRTVRALGTTRR